MLKQEREGSTHGRVGTVLKTTGTLLSLKFEQIQSVLPGTVSLNGKILYIDIQFLIFKHK